jgi:hypothetical protein
MVYTKNIESSNKRAVYDYDDIVSDAFTYSIQINKFHLTFYLFKVYNKSVYGKRHACISSIINSLKLEAIGANKINFIDERLFILTKMMKFMDHKLAYKFLDTFEDIVKSSAEHNFLVYMTNPVKTIVKIIYVIRFLVGKHPILEFKGKNIRSDLANIANHIIYLNTDLKSVEDVLVDKMYSGTTVIDLIGNIELIELLTNSLLDSVVSNLHVGSYQREFFMERSLCFDVVQNEISYDPDNEENSQKPMVQIVKPKKSKAKGRDVRTPYLKKLFYNIFKDEEHTLNMKSFKLVVGHQFKFESWRKSPDTQHLIDSIMMFIIGIFMVWYANEVVDNTKHIKDDSAKVESIRNGTYIGNVEDEYAELDGLSSHYIRYSLSLLFLNTFAIGYFIKDLQELLF